MAKNSTDQRRDSGGRYVTIDGQWFRQQAREAANTFVAPLRGAFRAVREASDPDQKAYRQGYEHGRRNEYKPPEPKE